MRALRHLCETGTDLTHSEVGALMSTDTKLWISGARRIDHRLQKASLKAYPETHDRRESHGESDR